jgi:hypothetical protein
MMLDERKQSAALKRDVLAVIFHYENFNEERK